MDYQSIAHLFEDPKRWSKHHGARRLDGAFVNHLHPSACSWSLMGAVKLIYGDTEKAKDVIDQLDAAVYRFPDRIFHRKWTAEVWSNQEERTHKEVLDLVKKLKI